MKHLSEEQIVLHYYGDAEGDAEVARHLSECASCQGEYERVRNLLAQIEPTEVPEPPAFFEEKTWLNVRDRLTQKPRRLRGWLVAPPKWALAASLAVLLMAAFLAGRYWRVDRRQPDVTQANPQRVVLVAVGDHLQRSQVLLIELMNSSSKDGVELVKERRQARDLLDANYLYRVSAQQTGDPAVTGLLDDLGRVLTEIANAPSELTPADLDAIRGRIQAQGLLFKIRVVGSEVESKVRRQEDAPGRGNTI